ncbi:MAG: hypothetical protein KGI38_12755, partial [Thaumarchaeota archaeon]|nr:hypothetical protein [Nitrososphaerota archaeon]
PEPTPRKISVKVVEDIRKWHRKGDSVRLVESLLSLKKFPFDDFYVGFLKLDDTAAYSNPQTVKRIASRLLSMDADGIIELAKQPKVANRQMGELFQNWLVRLPYPKVEEDEFKESDFVRDINGKKRTILVYKGSRKEMKAFANTELDAAIAKEPDLLMKVNGQYLIGEAKFISAFGGHQARSLDDAIDTFLLSAKGDVSRVAILDGVMWLDRQTKECKKVRTVNADMMSALLLPRYLREIQEAS